jgi:hypothetical protein
VGVAVALRWEGVPTVILGTEGGGGEMVRFRSRGRRGDAMGWRDGSGKGGLTGEVSCVGGEGGAPGLG